MFNYEGGARIVEPHCYGVSTANNECLRAFQVDGYSKTNKMGWKMFDLSKATSIRVLDEKFIPRSDYKRGDKGMKIIYAEI